MISLLNIQESLFSLLALKLGDKASGIYSYVPDNVTYPFIRISDLHETDWSNNTHYGAKITIKIEAFSDAKSNNECLAILDAIKNTLKADELSIKNCIISNLSLPQSSIKQTASSLIWHGIQQVQLWLETLH